jgi:hypothetical protein
MTVSRTLGINQRTLHRLLDDIAVFVQKEASCGFLKLLYTKDQRIAQIEEYHRCIGTSVTSFQESFFHLHLLDL